MKITINTPKINKTPIKFKNLQNGDFFQYKKGGRWCDDVFLMINNQINSNGQCVNLTQMYKTGFLSWFDINDPSDTFRVFNSMELSDVKEFLD